MTTVTSLDVLGADVKVTPYEAGQGLPLFVEPAGDRLRDSIEEASSWLREHQEAFDRALADSGAIVLRGFPIGSTDDFQKLTEHLPTLQMGYAGGNAPRETVKGNVMESTRADKSVIIYLHQELAYNPQYPSRLAFYCSVASETGGETIVADVRKIEQRLPERLREAVREKGLRYIRNFRSPERSTGDPILDQFHNSWTSAFKTEDKAEVEAVCDARGVSWEWQPDGSITLVSDLPGFREHPVTGKTVWFNQLHTMALKPPVISPEMDAAMEQLYSSSDMTRPYVVQYGDGSPVEIEDLNAVYALFDELTVGFPWQSGDVMFVDNLHTAHGRNPFTGARDVQVQVFA